MANTKSAKKYAQISLIKKEKNKKRKSAIKSVVKKVLDAIERGDDRSILQKLMQEAECKLARAKNKRLFHRNTASRKISNLARKVSIAINGAS